MSNPPRQAILLVDHGSQLQEANDMLADVARLVAAEGPEYFVAFAHMELAPPTLEQGLEQCAAAGARDIVVHPYMLSPGRHATQDIPRLVAAAARKLPGVSCRVSEPLGLHRLLARVVLERVRAAAARTEPG